VVRIITALKRNIKVIGALLISKRGLAIHLHHLKKKTIIGG